MLNSMFMSFPGGPTAVHPSILPIRPTLVHNDPHYVTFDKAVHHFMGTCTYTLAKLCTNSSSLPFFSIEAKNEERGQSSVSYIQQVFVEVLGYNISMLKNESGRVMKEETFVALDCKTKCKCLGWDNIYNFQGSCNYTVAKTCGNTTVRFTVTSRNERQGNPSLSTLNSVSLEVHGLYITLRKDKKVYANGSLVRPPVNEPRVKVSQQGAYIQVETSFGLRLLFDGNQLFVQIDERYKANMCGLCGTYTDRQGDDFTTPSGTVANTVEEFGNSWRVQDDEWTCPSNPPPPLPSCDPDLKAEAQRECSILYSPLGPFTGCHWFVHPQPYEESCIYDHCASRGDRRQLCSSLESYAAACEVAEADLEEWREATVCANFTTPAPATTSTTTTAVSPGVCPLSCNFDYGVCGWQQLITDSFDWTRLSGPTPSELTGPSQDHSTGYGYYMYIEGDGVYLGDSARILSPECIASGRQCLQFWYHMYGVGDAMGLNVYYLEIRKAVRIWSKKGNQGDMWHKAQVEITVSGKFQLFHLIFEGIRGIDYRSDVAVDDISIQSGSCSFSSNTEVGSNPLTTANPDPAAFFDCNFDKDICGWTQLLTDSFNWMRLRGSTPSSLTGPSFDHTTGGGYYMYIEGDGVYNGDTARLLSPEITDTGHQCLQFWYHIYGTADTMGLAVYLLENRRTLKVWSMRNNQGDTWLRAEVDLNVSGPFQIILEGRRGTDYRSDVAVDDISIKPGGCSGPFVTKTATSTTTISGTEHSETSQSAISSTNIPNQPSAATKSPQSPISSTTEPQQTTVSLPPY
ncbi:uncharacterized protein LOC136753963 [Amia ocellicauda]|uniref:uncharacterized protein LOC136753963 n=1 Tax=Amia ocellicauda TaxID=2972642 RepID=UPI0034646113